MSPPLTPRNGDCHPSQPVPALDVLPMDRSRSDRAPSAVYDYVRTLVLEGTLAPGAVISQVALAAQLGVSRTPLREALRRLQQEGLVEAEPRRRARIAPFDPVDLERVYTSRMLYEPLGVAVTVPRLTEHDLETIEFALAEMREMAIIRDYPAWEGAHRRYHDALVMHSSDSLRNAIATFAAWGDRYRRYYQHAIPQAWEIGDHEHQAIAVACRAGDEREAAEQLAMHFGRTALALLARLAPEREPVEIRAALRLVTGRPAPGP